MILKYLGTFLLTIGAFRLCLRCGWSAALYGGTTGYILQHCAERITEITQALLGVPPGWGEKLLLAAGTALVCLCFVLVLRSRYNISEYDCYSGREGNVMLLTAAAAAGVVIVLGPLILTDPEMLYLNIISVLLCVLVLVVSMCQIRQAESKKKAQLAEQLLQAERSRYALEKETVEAINIRCHDIKLRAENGVRGAGSGVEQQVTDVHEQADRADMHGGRAAAGFHGGRRHLRLVRQHPGQRHGGGGSAG